MQTNARQFEKYIFDLKDESGIPILSTGRKTGFLGFIICLRNIFELFDTYNPSGLDYLLTFKLSQDHLETFFGAIRSRGGFNNNPNAYQFQNAFKRLLTKTELKYFDGNTNCISDCLDILHISSRNTLYSEPAMYEYENDLDLLSVNDHDYVQTMWRLNPYVEDIVSYIAGFIASRIISKNICNICAEQLIVKGFKGTSDSKESPLLIKIKNRGGLLIPTKDIITICSNSEKLLRQNINKLFETKYINILKGHAFAKSSNVFDNKQNE